MSVKRVGASYWLFLVVLGLLLVHVLMGLNQRIENTRIKPFLDSSIPLFWKDYVARHYQAQNDPVVAQQSQYIVYVGADGLSNRMIAIASLFGVAQLTDRILLLDWETSSSRCEATFYDLFQDPDGVILGYHRFHNHIQKSPPDNGILKSCTIELSHHDDVAYQMLFATRFNFLSHCQYVLVKRCNQFFLGRILSYSLLKDEHVTLNQTFKFSKNPFSLIYKQLFVPRKEIQSKFLDYKRKYLNSDTQFASIHLRSAFLRDSTFSDCMKELNVSFSNSVVYISSDSHAFRSEVSVKVSSFPNVTLLPSITIVNDSDSEDVKDISALHRNAGDVKAALLEQMVISEAYFCIFSSPTSTYSAVAAANGRCLHHISLPWCKPINNNPAFHIEKYILPNPFESLKFQNYSFVSAKIPLIYKPYRIKLSSFQRSLIPGMYFQMLFLGNFVDIVIENPLSMYKRGYSLSGKSLIEDFPELNPLKLKFLDRGELILNPKCSSQTVKGKLTLRAGESLPNNAILFRTLQVISLPHCSR